MLFEIAPTLENNFGKYKDLPTLFELASGVSLRDYFRFGALAVTHFNQADIFDESKHPQEDPNGYCGLHPSIKFEDVQFAQETVEKLLPLLSQSIDDAQCRLKSLDFAAHRQKLACSK